MGNVVDAVPPPTGRGVRPALVVAVAASAMAGLVHASAARNHDGDRLLVWMFVLCAAAQVLWAAVALVRPSRPVLATGLVINGGALLVWALTRTVGISFVGSLAEVESAGTPDLVAALFAAISVVGSIRMLARPVARAVLAPAWAGALAVVALLATMPALRAEHTHEHGGDTHLEAGAHGHGAGSEHAHGDDAGHGDHDEPPHGPAGHGHVDDDAHGGAGHSEGDDGHGHDETASGDLASHGHATDGATAHGDHPPSTDGSHGHPPASPGAPNHPHPPADPGDPDPDHPHPPDDPDDPAPDGPIISLDDPRVSAAQRQIAQELIDGVKTALTGKTVASITAAGYSWIGDGGGGGYQHYVNWSYLTDGIELNPAKIESVVVQNGQIVSGMYILNLGKTMADVPALAGPLTTWHDHQNLCFEGTMLVGLAVNGVCQRGTLLPTPPMLHVWLVPHPCGPFAGIETHGGAGCHDDH